MTPCDRPKAEASASGHGAATIAGRDNYHVSGGLTINKTAEQLSPQLQHLVRLLQIKDPTGVYLQRFIRELEEK